MIHRLFRNQKLVPAAAHLYVSNERDKLIVASVHQNSDGIYFEQSGARLFDYWPNDEQLGQAFKDAFEAFAPKDADLRNHKKTDWPAYKASRLRSARAFESEYQLVSCYSLNESNAIVRASMVHPAVPEVELSTSFNPKLPASRIGTLLAKLFETARGV